MGEFVLLVEPPAESHRCSMPDPSVSAMTRRPKFWYGTIWRCECGRQWKLVYLREVYCVGQYVTRWRPYPRWYERATVSEDP
jgi:hypothetical protein